MIGVKTTGSNGMGKLDSMEKGFNVLIRILVYSSALYFFSFVTADTDLWGHIKFGRDLWVAGALNRFDIYSYTAFGSAWINHEWLSELFMSLVYQALGSPGLLIGKLLVGFAIIYLLSQISFHRHCHPFVYGVVFVLAVFVMSPGFMIRPQILTYLFTAYYLYVFHMYLERGKNLLWSLPIIMILWVNCHGGFLVGAGIYPVVVAGELITRCRKNKGAGSLWTLLIWLVLTEASVFVNPYGDRLLTFLYESLSLPRWVGEWNPVGIFDLSHLRFKMLVLLFMASCLFRNKDRRYWEIGIIALALIYAFRHQRHTPLFAIAAAPYLSENISLMVRRIGLFDRIRSFQSYAILNVFVCILVGYQLSFAGYKYVKARFNIIVDPTEYPVYAVHFLKQNGIKGKILLPFEWGEYVIWKLYPDCRVSIDGRFRTVYPEEVLDAHFEAAGDTAKLQDLLEKYPSDIILGRQNPVYQQLISTQDEWIYVYSDPISIVFIRNSVSQRGVLEKLRTKGLIYPGEALSIYFP